MKYIVLIGDGMADYALPELKGKTPLQVARTPNMDFVAANGQVGIVRTVPPRMVPASDVANLSILGYDPRKFYTGRGPLEAANMGVKLQKGQVAFRCNLVTAAGDKLVDYSAGHITNKEASILIEFIEKKLGTDNVKFYPGVSYRHLAVIKDEKHTLLKVKCFPPHDIMGGAIPRHLPRGRNAKTLITLMEKSRELLKGHEINQVRVDLGENPANMIWLWGQGIKSRLPSFTEKYGVEGSVISAVNLIKGIAHVIGLEPLEVPGATGYYDTNYLGKAEYALNSLKEKDFVYVHVEAPDEASHNKDILAKINTIEKFDELVVGTVLKALEKKRQLYRILVMPDHYTPISVGTHIAEPVLFAIMGKDLEADAIKEFNEAAVRRTRLNFDHGYQLMDYLMHKSR